MTQTKKVTINGFKFYVWPYVSKGGCFRGKLMIHATRKEKGTRFIPSWNKKTEAQLVTSILAYGVKNGLWTEDMLRDKSAILVERMDGVPRAAGGGGNRTPIAPSAVYSVLDLMNPKEAQPTEATAEEEAAVEETEEALPEHEVQDDEDVSEDSEEEGIEDEDEEAPAPSNWVQPGTKNSGKEKKPSKRKGK